MNDDDVVEYCPSCYEPYYIKQCECEETYNSTFKRCSECSVVLCRLCEHCYNSKRYNTRYFHNKSARQKYKPKAKPEDDKPSTELPCSSSVTVAKGKPKEDEVVYITYVFSPTYFFVLKEHQIEYYHKLCQELAKEYHSNRDFVDDPKMGVMYAAKLHDYNLGVYNFMGGMQWVRALVLDVLSEAVYVRLPDSGKEFMLCSSNLRHLHRKFNIGCDLAYECRLAGLKAADDEWSEPAVSLMKSWLGRPLRAHLEPPEATKNKKSLWHQEPPVLNLTLYDHVADSDNPVCLNTLMIQHNYAVPIAPLINESDVTEKEVIKKSENESVIQDPLKLRVVILQYQSPRLIYISLVDQQDTYSEMYKKLHDYYHKNKNETKTVWRVSDKCCTVCIKLKVWCRGVVMEIEGEKAMIYYSDSAFVETIPVANLRELPPDFASIDDAAIKCHISGVTPAVDDEWRSLTNYGEELRTLSIDTKVSITQAGDLKDKSMPIDLWVLHTYEGGALDPYRYEWRCLSDKIIQQGLDVADIRDQITPYENDDESDDCGSSKSTPYDGDNLNEKEDAPTSSISSNDIVLPDWLPPEPFPSKKFTGIPTHIDNDGVIYLHDIKQQETLDHIYKVLGKRFKKPDLDAKYVKWTVGEPCIAMFSLDKQFYRARILEVNQKKLLCLVHYIDYGNEEQRPFTKLRYTFLLNQIPTQAHKCILSGIRPVNGQWDNEALRYIRQWILEKHCSIKIVGEAIDDLVPIYLECNDRCINDCLVGMKLAVEQDENDDQTFLTYPKDYDDEFLCNITVINKTQVFELNIILGDKTVAIYNVVLEKIKAEGDNMPLLNGIYKHKACIVRSTVDNKWHRASILESCATTSQIKVKLVDFGNVEVHPLSDVRETCKEWTELKPATITVELHAVKLNPDVDIAVVKQKYTDILLCKGPFQAKIVDQASDSTLPCVILRNANGILVNEKLITEGVFVIAD